MDLQTVLRELARLDAETMTDDDRAALVGCVRAVVGRRALVGPAPAPVAAPQGAAAAPDPAADQPCCEHAAAALLAPEPGSGAPERAWPPHHPALRRRGRPALRLVPGPA